jgi:hypothetical protein
MRRWIRRLYDLRKRRCGLAPGAEPRVWREPAGMTPQQARDWRARYERIPARERPGYVLILGDLHEISLELQQELMVSAAVGRLCFTDAEGQPDRAGYQAYCAKVCDLEDRRAEWSAGARLLLYAAHDGSVSSQEGYYDLVRECYREAKAEQDGQLARMDVQLCGRSDDHEWYTADQDPPAQARTLLHHAQMSDPARATRLSPDGFLRMLRLRDPLRAAVPARGRRSHGGWVKSAWLMRKSPRRLGSPACPLNFAKTTRPPSRWR